jgi:mannosyltransferase OCH1-like enzyme
MIPKTIHYCWFGGNKMPQDEARYVEGWKDLLIDYKFKLWNEDNFDVDSVKFTEQAFRAKKWGFVTDYVRAYAVYHYGGIYLDTDVEVIKPFDDLLNTNICFSGFEDESHVAPGLIFAGEKGCSIAKELMDVYSNINFINKDGTLNLTTVPKILTGILLKHGLQQNNSYQNIGCITVYPTDYFCPKSFKTGLLNITGNTYSIHHFKASWHSENVIKEFKERWNIFAKYGDTELSNQYIKLMAENNHLKVNDINTMNLFNVYKIAIKRTFKKILGKRIITLIKKYGNNWHSNI